MSYAPAIYAGCNGLSNCPTSRLPGCRALTNGCNHYLLANAPREGALDVESQLIQDPTQTFVGGAEVCWLTWTAGDHWRAARFSTPAISLSISSVVLK